MSVRAAVTVLLALQVAAPAPDAAAIVNALAGALRNQYIDADVAERMASAMRSDMSAGVYARQTTRSDLAKALTETLQRVSGDRHLRIVDGPPPARLLSGKPTVGRVEILDGGIGYFEVPSFTEPAAAAAAPIAAAMSRLSPANALVFDVRGNGGGQPATVALLAAYVLEPRSVLLGTIVNRSFGSQVDDRTPATVDGPRFGTTKPVFILTDRRSASGAEAFAYHLQSLGRVTVVGEQTAGAANPGGFVWLPEQFSVFIATGRVTNAMTGTNWEGVGVSPDILSDAQSALEVALREARVRLIRK